jgi:hypothetical protein
MLDIFLNSNLILNKKKKIQSKKQLKKKISCRILSGHVVFQQTYMVQISFIYLFLIFNYIESLCNQCNLLLIVLLLMGRLDWQ